MAHSLGSSTFETFWISTSYLLSSAICQPVIASAGRYFGNRNLLLTSVVFFIIGTTFCALAHSFATMVVGRCIQGIGGGGVIALTQVIFSDIVPLICLPHYYAMVLGSWAVGASLVLYLVALSSSKARGGGVFTSTILSASLGFLLRFFSSDLATNRAFLSYTD